MVSKRVELEGGVNPLFREEPSDDDDVDVETVEPICFQYLTKMDHNYSNTWGLQERPQSRPEAPDFLHDVKSEPSGLTVSTSPGVVTHYNGYDNVADPSYSVGTVSSTRQSSDKYINKDRNESPTPCFGQPFTSIVPTVCVKSEDQIFGTSEEQVAKRLDRQTPTTVGSLRTASPAQTTSANSPLFLCHQSSPGRYRLKIISNGRAKVVQSYNSSVVSTAPKDSASSFSLVSQSSTPSYISKPVGLKRVHMILPRGSNIDMKKVLYNPRISVTAPRVSGAAVMGAQGDTSFSPIRIESVTSLQPNYRPPGAQATPIRHRITTTPTITTTTTPLIRVTPSAPAVYSATPSADIRTYTTASTSVDTSVTASDSRTPDSVKNINRMIGDDNGRISGTVNSTSSPTPIEKEQPSKGYIRAKPFAALKHCSTSDLSLTNLSASRFTLPSSPNINLSDKPTSTIANCNVVKTYRPQIQVKKTLSSNKDTAKCSTQVVPDSGSAICNSNHVPPQALEQKQTVDSVTDTATPANPPSAHPHCVKPSAKQQGRPMRKPKRKTRKRKRLTKNKYSSKKTSLTALREVLRQTVEALAADEPRTSPLVTESATLLPGKNKWKKLQEPVAEMCSPSVRNEEQVTQAAPEIERDDRDTHSLQQDSAEMGRSTRKDTSVVEKLATDRIPRVVLDRINLPKDSNGRCIITRNCANAAKKIEKPRDISVTVEDNNSRYENTACPEVAKNGETDICSEIAMTVDSSGEDTLTAESGNVTPTMEMEDSVSVNISPALGTGSLREKVANVTDVEDVSVQRKRGIMTSRMSRQRKLKNNCNRRNNTCGRVTETLVNYFVKQEKQREEVERQREQQEADEDRAFFTSILPSIKQLSPSCKIRFRMEVLDALNLILSENSTRNFNEDPAVRKFDSQRHCERTPAYNNTMVDRWHTETVTRQSRSCNGKFGQQISVTPDLVRGNAAFKHDSSNEDVEETKKSSIHHTSSSLPKNQIGNTTTSNEICDENKDKSHRQSTCVERSDCCQSDNLSSENDSEINLGTRTRESHPPENSSEMAASQPQRSKNLQKNDPPEDRGDNRAKTQVCDNSHSLNDTSTRITSESQCRMTTSAPYTGATAIENERVSGDEETLAKLGETTSTRKRSRRKSDSCEDPNDDEYTPRVLTHRRPRRRSAPTRNVQVSRSTRSQVKGDDKEGGNGSEVNSAFVRKLRSLSPRSYMYF